MSPSDTFTLLGPLHRVQATGMLAELPADRCVGPAAADHALDLLRSLRSHDRAAPRRIVVGAIPFDPQRPARLYVPEQVEWQPGSVSGFGAPPTPVTRPSSPLPRPPVDPEYRSAVAAALRGIDAGLLRKVVLARAIDVQCDPAPDDGALRRLTDRLRSGDPSGYTFRVDLPDGTLVGSTPELVAAVRGRRLVSHPLAGTTTRQAEPEQDAAAAARLLASGKDLAEHGALVDDLVDRLGPVADHLDVPAHPTPFATPTLWHLGTRITGVVRPGRSVLDVAYAVHPTPAVGGVPAEAAAPLIRILEAADRGFYAGLVGWMDQTGQGEWVLALRCAHIAGSSVRLHAGAGIVAGSTPQGEHAETEAKLRPMLAAVTAELSVTGIDAVSSVAPSSLLVPA